MDKGAPIPSSPPSETGRSSCARQDAGLGIFRAAEATILSKMFIYCLNGAVSCKMRGLKTGGKQALLAEIWAIAYCAYD
jgi:hypothetical protein